MTTFHTFADPYWLLLLLAAPLWIVLRRRRAGHGALVVSRLPARRGGRWRLELPFALRLLAFAAAVVALARPQLGYAWEESTTEGIDIQLVLDVSGSMGAEDFQPDNRLAVAKRVLRDFVSRRPADRIGLTVFGGTALTRSPLTTDRRMLDELLAGIELSELADGTAIGSALASGANRLRASEAKSKVLVLVTDGVNNAGEIDPRSAAALARGLGIRIYAVGVGRTGRAAVPVQVRDAWTGRSEVRRVMMEVEVDQELLEELARTTSGRAFRATDPDALARVFAEIDRLERTPIAVKRYVRHQEAFEPFAWTAFALVLAPLGLAALKVTVEP